VTQFKTPSDVLSYYQLRDQWVDNLRKAVPMLLRKAKEAGVPMPDAVGLGCLTWRRDDNDYSPTAEVTIIYDERDHNYGLSSGLRFTLRRLRGSAWTPEFRYEALSEVDVEGAADEFFRLLATAIDEEKKFERFVAECAANGDYSYVHKSSRQRAKILRDKPHLKGLV